MHLKSYAKLWRTRAIDKNCCEVALRFYLIEPKLELKVESNDLSLFYLPLRYNPAYNNGFGLKYGIAGSTGYG